MQAAICEPLHGVPHILTPEVNTRGAMIGPKHIDGNKQQYF